MAGPRAQPDKDERHRVPRGGTHFAGGLLCRRSINLGSGQVTAVVRGLDLRSRVRKSGEALCMVARRDARPATLSQWFPQCDERPQALPASVTKVFSLST
jgi:hypothetical protein